MEVVPKSGHIHTQQPFGDCQLHVEFASPRLRRARARDAATAASPDGPYEIQVLDSYQNKTYADGQARRCTASPAAGKRLAPAGRMADLRHHFSRPAF